VKTKSSRATRIFEQDFNDPGMLVVPFSFNWTPTTTGLYSIQVKVELGPHAVRAGVVDSNTRNNSVTFKVDAVPAKATLKR
jgi:subtilase family serine protease